MNYSIPHRFEHVLYPCTFLKEKGKLVWLHKLDFSAFLDVRSPLKPPFWLVWWPVQCFLASNEWLLQQTSAQPWPGPGINRKQVDGLKEFLKNPAIRKLRELQEENKEENSVIVFPAALVWEFSQLVLEISSRKSIFLVWSPTPVVWLGRLLQ